MSVQIVSVLLSLLTARYFLILFLWIYDLRACLHEGGVPQVGEVTCGGLPHLTCKRDHIKMRDCMDRRVTPPKRVTSPIWGPPPPCTGPKIRSTNESRRFSQN